MATKNPTPAQKKKPSPRAVKAAPKTQPDPVLCGAVESPSPIGMTDEEVNAYLASVAKGETALNGMEADISEKFREVTHQSQQNAQAIQQMAMQLEQARAQQQQFAGELKGYATLLISAEDSRRKPSKKAGKKKA